jgi:hypothetical protein
MQTEVSVNRVFVSGERVEPGAYRDIDSGAIVTVFEREELPEEVRIVHTPRRFARADDPVFDPGTLDLSRLLVEVA